MTTQIWPGIEQTDCAALTNAGVHYRCYVWRDTVRLSVEAAIYTEQEGGQEVFLHRETLYVTQGVQVEPAGPLSWGGDSPKVIAVGNRFICHYIDSDDGDTNFTLHRSTIEIRDTAATFAWDYRGSIPIGSHCLHDLQPHIGDTVTATSTTDFLYTYSTTVVNRIAIVRGNGLDWIDTAWVTNHVQAHAARVLCCSAFGTNAMIAFQATGAPVGLNARSFSWNNGAVVGGGLAVSSWGNAEYTQAGLAPLRDGPTNSFALVAESINLDSGADAARVPAIVYVGLRTDGSTGTNEHSCYHLRLLSRPWGYRGGPSGQNTSNVYCVAGYCNVGPDGEFTQRNAYVVNLAHSDWDDAPDHTLRPRIVANLNQGTLDTRSSGYTPAPSPPGPGPTFFTNQRRMNHISNASLPPPFGPFRATRTCALLGFAKMMPMSVVFDAPIQPVAGTVLSVVCHMEEPSVEPGDIQDQNLGEDLGNFLGPYPWTVGQGLEIGRCLVLGGGAPAVFDGIQVVENGYPWAPEIIEVSDLGIGVTVPAGLYQYCATYEWRDAQGQLHRSAPSTVIEHDHAAGSINVEVSTMTCSQKDNLYWYRFANPIEIVIWRASDDGIFRRVYGMFTGSIYRVRDTPANDPSTYSVVVNDNVGPATIVEHEILPYQLLTGGGWTPLPPYCPPAFTTMAKWQNRLWGASSEDPRVLWYSQEVLPEPGGVNSLPPEWNSSLVYRVDEVGRITAMQAMDNSLALFTDRGVYLLTGFPADSTGANPSLQLQTVSTGTGCIEPRSVVLTPVGIFFQALKGIYLLSRTGELEYRGAPVEDWVREGGNIRAATLLEDRHEVRFVSYAQDTDIDEGGVPFVLCYNYLFDLWSNFVGETSPVGGAYWRGAEGETLHVLISRYSMAMEELSGDAAPYGTTFSGAYCRVTTDRIALDGIAGFQRVKMIGIALNTTSVIDLQVRAFYDVTGLDTEVTETVVFENHASNILRFKPAVQKCNAFRLEISEVIPLVNIDMPGFQITGIHVEVGIKRGVFKGAA